MSVCFVRSLTPVTDSRLRRYLSFLSKKSYPYFVIAWQRDADKKDIPGTKLFRLPCSESGGYKNTLKFAAWNLYVLYELYKCRKNYQTIHAVNLDTGLVAMIFAKLFGKRVVFDIYDKYSDSRNMQGTLCRIIDRIEKWVSDNAVATILPDDLRVSQQGYRPKHLLIVENVPQYDQLDNIGQESASGDKPEMTQRKEKIIIFYGGTLEPVYRGLEDFIHVVSGLPRFEFRIAGSGGLSSYIARKAGETNNVIFLGLMTPNQVLEESKKSDILLALYYKSNRNNRYAAPNKYWEHLIFGKPLITTAGIPPGIKVLENNTGWAIDDTQAAQLELLNALSREEIAQKALNAKKLWSEIYGYQHFENQYNDYYKMLVG